MVEFTVALQRLDKPSNPEDPLSRGWLSCLRFRRIGGIRGEGFGAGSRFGGGGTAGVGEFQAVKQRSASRRPAHTEGKNLILKEAGSLFDLAVQRFLKLSEVIQGKGQSPVEPLDLPPKVRQTD